MTVTPADADFIVIFDGVCGLCHRAVRWIMKRDRRRCFRFCPMQSGRAAELLRENNIDASTDETMVLILGDRWFVKSEAALEIARVLGFPWSGLAVTRVVPVAFRDALYDQVARRRLGWFGRRQICELTELEADRFLT